MKRLILALALLVTPAHAAGKSDLPKQPACVPGAPVKIVVVRGEPDLVFVPVHVNVFQALQTKCKMPGRVVWNGGCWIPSRIPRS